MRIYQGGGGWHIHGIQQENQQICTGKRGEQGPMVIRASSHGTSTIIADLEPDRQKADDHNGVPDPAALVVREGSRQSGSEHDQIRGNGDDEVCAAQATEKGNVDQDQGRGDDPVQIADPEYLAEIFLVGIWDVFVGVVHDRVFVGYAFAGSHGEV